MASVTKMRNLVKEALSVHLFILRIFGLLPFENHELLFRFYSLTIYLFLTVPLPLLSIIFYFTRESFDVNAFTESAFITVELATIALKYLPFIINSSKILSVVRILEEPIFSNNFNQKQKYILDDCNTVCKRCLWFCLANCFIGCPIYAFFPALMKRDTIPTEIWLPIDNPKGTPTYVMSYIFVCAGSWYDAFTNAAYDTFVSSLVYQATAQIKILKDNLTNLQEDADIEILQYYPKFKNNISVRNILIENKIKNCLIHHQHIISFVNSYEKHFTRGVFIQFLGGSLVICISVFELTIAEPSSLIFFYALIYTSTIFFEIFLYCYFGSTLRDESQSITTAIYMGNWYEYSPKAKKLLLILMEKSNKSITVTAGAVLDLSLETFSTILRRAYSFYAVLKQYQ